MSHRSAILGTDSKGRDLTYAEADLKKLSLRSGGRCAFPDCRALLTWADPQSGEVTVLGHIAHIVARNEDGPRGRSTLSKGDRNRYENLILLCTKHHQLVDARSNESFWTIERLTQLRDDHELWVSAELSRGQPAQSSLAPSQVDTVYSTLLPVERVPQFVYRAPTPHRRRSDLPHDPQEGMFPLMAPYALHDGHIYLFQDPRRLAHIDGLLESSSAKTTREELGAVVETPDGLRIVQQLLNRSLNKLAGRRELVLDREHRRYYFGPKEPGEPRVETYRSLTGRSTDLSVVWQPVIRARNEKRDYWIHRAVSLGFLVVGPNTWVLAMRPEMHISADGINPYPSQKVGARVTRRKSRMFNADLLKELQFWRHFLGEGMPRVVMKYSETQAVHVSTTLLSGEVTWPGIPARHDVHYSNVEYLDDLLTIAETIEVEDDDWDDLPDGPDRDADVEIGDTDD